MSFGIYYYVDEKNHAPVKQYLTKLPIHERAEVYAYLKHLSEAGYKIRRPFADYLGGKTGLYELRPGRHRVLYFFIKESKIILLHALLKKTNEIPKTEINIARKRKAACEILLKVDRVNFEE